MNNFSLDSAQNHNQQEDTINDLVEKYHIFQELTPENITRLKRVLHDAYWHGFCHGYEKKYTKLI